MGSEILGELLGDQFKGYIFRITGGNDKQGFPMKQGVLINGRVRLLLKKSKFPPPLIFNYSYQYLPPKKKG